jgi:hypothetical protein
MTNKRKMPSRGGNKRRPTAQGPRSRAQPYVMEIPLQRGLLELATVGAQSFLWLASVAAIILALGGAAFGVWTLRPVPGYVSEAVEMGSPFGVTFRVENTNGWFALSHLKISCLLVRPPPSDALSVKAKLSLITSSVGPGESASFTCPFRAALGGATGDDLDVALRSELYFHSEYDMPVIGSMSLTDTGGPFVLNTRLLPPRWTGKPGLQ